MEMRKPQVGDTVYLKPINNQGRRSNGILERQVTRVGRKYFYVADLSEEKRSFRSEIKINIETMEEDQDYRLGEWKAYYSLQDIEDERECAEIGQQLSRIFIGSRHGLTLDQLRRIKAITEEGKGDV